MLAEIFKFKKLLYPLVLIGILAAYVTNFMEWNSNFSIPMFSNMIRFDNVALAFSGVILVTAFFWFILPNMFFRKTTLFKENWDFSYDHKRATLIGNLGEASWEWDTVSNYFESAYFFHFYFSPKSFFLIPKANIPFEDQHIIRGILKDK